jgi:hypothetical protein
MKNTHTLTDVLPDRISIPRSVRGDFIINIQFICHNDPNSGIHLCLPAYDHDTIIQIKSKIVEIFRSTISTIKMYFYIDDIILEDTFTVSRFKSTGHKFITAKIID